MNDIWLPLGTAIIGALAALAGTVISPWVGARIGHRQWKRDKLSEYAENYITVITEVMMNPISKVPGDIAALDELEIRISKLRSAAGNLVIYASMRLGMEALEAASDYHEALSAILAEDPPERCQELRKKFRNQALLTVELIRQELGIGPWDGRTLPAKFDPSPQTPA